MSIFDFVTNAGEKLRAAIDPEAPTTPDHTPAGITEEGPLTVTAGKLHMHLEDSGLAPEDLSVSFRDGVATVEGTVSAAADREKIILALGNVEGVSRVEDRLVVEEEAVREPVFHTVQPGETLSRIAEAHYGDPTKYPILFEANQPLLQDPDRIYAGQVLRVPELGD